MNTDTTFSPRLPVSPPQFDGATYEPARDRSRLFIQLERVYTALAMGEWMTLAQLAAATGDPEASVSARMRDLRKPQFGGHTVERRYVRRGLWEYRLCLHRPDPALNVPGQTSATSTMEVVAA